LLLSGGSAIDAYPVIAQAVESGGIERLAIGLVDERYGPVGHRDSNAALIDQKSRLPRLCQQRQLEFRAVLADGLSLEQTATAYDDWLKQAMARSVRTVAILGIGTDGHTAGIMPMAQPVFDRTFIDTPRMVVGYQIDYGQHRQRITVTPQLLYACSNIVLMASGATKRAVLQQALFDSPLPLHHFPASLLRGCQQVEVFTDQSLQ
jgi:6-phosphogluconolactonase/glucosamine-6-phosphate isomerase/deaminase